ncbi:MAG: DUF938 domain-containing protein [Magnetovibrionaceae bacterium]
MVDQTDDRQFSPSTQRNRDVIAEVLGERLPETGKVLEIASGSGEHAVHLAPRHPGLTWQTSDTDEVALRSIRAWIDHSGLDLPEPLHLDVCAGRWDGIDAVDAILCINMIHISPWAACEGLMRGAGRHLKPGGLLYLYGPYRINGKQTSESNVSFESWLKSLDPAYGVRDLDDVRKVAEGSGMSFVEALPMPANNFSVVFNKASD